MDQFHGPVKTIFKISMFPSGIAAGRTYNVVVKENDVWLALLYENSDLSKAIKFYTDITDKVSKTGMYKTKTTELDSFHCTVQFELDVLPTWMYAPSNDRGE